MGAAPALAVVGGGRMGEAIVAGLLASAKLEAADIVVAEPDAARREVFAAHGIAVVADAAEVVGSAPTVLLAVKPQVIDAVVAHLADELAPGALVVSIAVGVSTARLESLLPAGTPVVRVMPNTPTMVGAGMAVISGGSSATTADVDRVRSLFEAVGDALVIDERAQDAAAAISGSGPAYVALFIDALARAGVRQGLSREVAQRLAVQTFKGTALLIESTGMHPEELVDGVSSPGGTTIAAVEVLEAGAVRGTISSAVGAAVRRAKELG